MEKKYLNTKECGQLTNRTAGAIRNLVMRRAIPFRKPGGRLLFLRSEIEAWIENAEGLKLVEYDNGYELKETKG